MKRKAFEIILCSLLLLNYLELSSQTHPNDYCDEFHDFGFVKDFSVTVSDEAGTALTQPWVGGLNACQFSALDLNLDGIKDLFVFDRHGNRILPFINAGMPGVVDLTYAPEYQIRFPDLREWANLVDYDGDGKEDLFTYTTGGIRIFKNITDTDIKFKLHVPLLLSFYYNGYVNLFALIDDYPVFSDIDLDGDIDILNFFTLGKYLNYHRNLSVEKYGVIDSLDFRLEEQCWGYFEENESSNVLTLGINCESDNDSRRDRHAGSTLLALDLDGDLDKDLIIGDVDFATLAGLTNGGTTDSAYMTGQDTLFPVYSRSVELMSMPLPTYVDVNNDGSNDLLVSPFDPGLDRTENLKSVWYYKNNGTTGNPLFEFVQDDFLQDKMIDLGAGAYPVVVDVDGDGLDDLLVGNYGYLDSTWYLLGYLYFEFRTQIAFFKNTGTETNPVYHLSDLDFGGFSSLKTTGAYPAMTDLDGDGDPDLVAGNEDGTLYFFENLAGPGTLPVFAPPLQGYQGIDAGAYSTPQFVDLNRDQLVDLVIGAADGTLKYYENTGTAGNPVFTLVNSNLGGVDVTNPNLSLDGFSTPCFFDLNGEYRLFVGSEFGDIFYYNDIDDNLDGDFTLVEPQLLYIREGWRSGVAVLDINGDDYADMVIGNYGGGLAMYRGVTPPPYDIDEPKDHNIKTLQIFPNPSRGKSDIRYRISDIRYVTLSLFDGYGKKVMDLVNEKQTAGEHSVKLNATGLSDGIYFLLLKAGDHLEAAKVVIMR